MLNGFKSEVQYPCVALQKRRLCRQQLKLMNASFLTLEDGIPGFLHASDGMYCHERVNVSQLNTHLPFTACVLYRKDVNLLQFMCLIT